MNYKYKVRGWVVCIILVFALLTFITSCASNRNMENNQTGQTGGAQELAQPNQFGLAGDNQRIADGDQPGDNLRMAEAGQTNQTGDNQQANQAGNTGYRVGDAIKINDTQLTVNEVKKSAGGEFDKPKSGIELVQLKLNIGTSVEDSTPTEAGIRNPHL